ncbi:MAG: exopolyphosphatase [Gammaproteobacteria bacterium]|nr:exopolyphosphatase [Gammaproteobacteria bacterium]
MSYTPQEPFAAVDLGSNSFHMIVANYGDGRLQVIDRMKEMVRLASGLDGKRNLSHESMDAAVQSLERFGQRIHDLPHANVRAVGTNTLRQARNGKAFLTRARQALGHPIEVIAGREEARLIFLGVVHSVYNESDRRLVVDIGGGSTEVIIGRGFDATHMESLYMGCVGTSERFFANGEISAKRMRRAMLFAHQELESIRATYRKVGWDSALGASGTILAIEEAMRHKGWSDAGITAEALARLRDHLIEASNVHDLQLEGISDQRKPVFAGGVAILSAVFEALSINRMTVADGALREGLLHDLIGRVHDQDVRDKTVMDLAQRYGADPEQAKRVSATADNLFAQVRPAWSLDRRPDQKLLDWAAQVHEIGLSIAHAQYHHHGAYVLANSDMPGFSREEQLNLAMLVRLHRRKFATDELLQVAEDSRARVARLCILLRLAVLLNRSRSTSGLPEIHARAGDSELDLQFPEGWIGDHPLTQTDLDAERELLDAAGINLKYT